LHSIKELTLPQIHRWVEQNELYGRLKLFTHYFIINRHPNNDKVSFDPKKDGVQHGLIAHVQIGSQITTYFVKTHSRGQSRGSSSSAQVDTREMIVYKQLELIKVGPEVFFFYNDFDIRELFIATSSLGPDFKTFEQLTNKAEFKDIFDNNDEYQRGLVLVDLLSKILFINDVSNNPANFG